MNKFLEKKLQLDLPRDLSALTSSNVATNWNTTKGISVRMGNYN